MVKAKILIIPVNKTSAPSNQFSVGKPNIIQAPVPKTKPAIAL
jgi:hypothetical protein